MIPDGRFFQPTWRGLIVEGIPMLIELLYLKVKAVVTTAKNRFTW